MPLFTSPCSSSSHKSKATPYCSMHPLHCHMILRFYPTSADCSRTCLLAYRRSRTRTGWRISFSCSARMPLGVFHLYRACILLAFPSPPPGIKKDTLSDAPSIAQRGAGNSGRSPARLTFHTTSIQANKLSFTINFLYHVKIYRKIFEGLYYTTDIPLPPRMVSILLFP